MRRYLVFAFALLSLFSQTIIGQDSWLWPVKGLETGKGIISRPDSYIGKDYNTDNLYITAPEGTEIISPADGIIISTGVYYQIDMFISTSRGHNSESNFDASIIKFSESNPDLNPKYICGSLCISISNSTKLFIKGLKGSHTFKLGQKIHKGDFLGCIAHSYKGFEEPTLCVSVSKNSRPADPMTPFGLKSTFIPPKEIKPITDISKTQALKDFQIFTDAVEECFPSLYRCVTESELDSLKTWAKNKIMESSPDTIISYDSFYKLIRTCFSHINDSHIYLFPALWDNGVPEYQPAIWIGLFKDSMRVTNTDITQKDLFGKTIVRVNGFDADSARKASLSRIYDYDANVQSYPEFLMAFNSLSVYSKDHYDLDVEFSDGTRKSISEIKYSKLKLMHPFEFRMINYYGSKKFEAKMINDSTAYLGLGSFYLNEIQMEKLSSFVDSVSKAWVPNFIVDVRNNAGGSSVVLEKIWSWFAKDTLKLNGCRRINKVKDFKTFKYTDNYCGLEGVLFSGYAPVKGIDGLCDTTFRHVYYPDGNINYKGKLYVLTNESSISAATIFPALAVRSHRGVTVGRETCSAYHSLTALQFANFILPNSKVRFALPLVEDVFDTQINDRVPYGRGVLPDYEVPLTFEEITGGKGQDLILDHALELIANNQYINYDNPFVEDQDEPDDCAYWIYLVIGAAVLAVIIISSIFIVRMKRRKPHHLL